MRVFLLVSCLLLLASGAFARDSSRSRRGINTGGACTTVTLSSSSAGATVMSSNGYATQVSIITTSPASGVWLMKTAGICSSTQTGAGGYYLQPTKGQGYDFISDVEGWYGPICGILDSGTTPVDLSVCPQ